MEYSRRSRRTSSGTIEVREGSEGPKYDPYHYTEFRVTRNSHSAKLHLGLVEWCKIDEELVPGGDCIHDRSVEAFEDFIGISLKSLQRAVNRFAACCAKPDPQGQSGYPGEMLIVCANCGKVIDSDFNLSHII